MPLSPVEEKTVMGIRIKRCLTGLKLSLIHILDISGEVRNPGVYQVSEGTRVFEVIACAGGMTEEAAAEYINQAEMVYDGQKIVVPNREEAVSFSAETENSNVQGKVNLNTATKEELMTLPGIGNSKAENIIEYRKSNGRFSSAEELKNVEGIKDGIFNKIKERITVS